MLAKLEIIVNDQCIQSLGYNKVGKLIYTLNEQISSNLEAIYKVRVNSFNKQSKLAYIDYAPSAQGIINLVYTNVQPGSYLLCQMLWQGDEYKLPKFSDKIKLLGKYVIILPQENKHYFSKQLENKDLLLPTVNKYSNLGIIFRSSINGISDYKLVEAEIDFLHEQLALVKLHVANEVGKITKPGYKFLQLLRESNLCSEIEVITNSQLIFDYILPYLDLWQLSAVTLDESLKVENKRLEASLVIDSSEFGVEIHKLSGINLIDVNSKGSSLNFYQVNYLAIDEIICQVYLRDLTGIILIDFIKNMSIKDEKNLQTKLEELLAGDWRKNQVLGFTKAGICEIIRNK